MSMESTCLAARLAFCALFGSFRACCAAPTKLLFPELAAAFPLVTTVLVPACASFLKPNVLQAAHTHHCLARPSEQTNVLSSPWSRQDSIFRMCYLSCMLASIPR